LLFQDINDYANARQYYVTRTVSVLLFASAVSYANIGAQSKGGLPGCSPHTNLNLRRTRIL